ncbi:MAG TPA: xanthine dehydrogenase family protein molybdopterin-binding subunit [Vicinamibacterales bacterium]|nr:xanthine dehydrogenase family protein molybdopterin-binding subunit [Vicinamibacterales bacterium]
MIGEGINRLDGRLKVTGAATYSAEWPLERLTYGVIVQSTIARGTITRFDTAEAAAQPGVLAILTADNAPRLPQHGRAGVNPPAGRVVSALQDRDIRYNGEPIAIVIAESFEQATYAASLVRASYSAEVPAVDMQAELARAEPVTEKILGQFEPASRRGDVDGALAEAEVRLDLSYTTPLETHNAMEPHSTIASWSGEQLTLYDATQYVYGVRRFVAKTLGIPDEHVRVVSKFTGGAFGSKGSAWSHVVLAAMAARHVGRPVKVVLSRKQMFGLVGARPYTVQQITIGARRDGTITAIRQDVASSTSTFENWIESSTLQTRMLYDVPNVATAQKLVKLNLGTPTFNRGPGESSGTFALESALDELADALSLDPIELRLRNYAEKDPETGQPFSSKLLRECYQKGAESFGWARRQPRPRSMRQGDTLIGWGMSTATYPAKRLPASALAQLASDGTIVVRAATHEFGTGTYTAMSQVAASALSVPVSRIRFELGDTDYPENPISAGSMTASSTGPAVQAAALALDERIRALGGRIADVDNCRALVAAHPGMAIEGRATVKPGDERQRYSMHSFGAVFVEVHVDPELGQIRVTRAVGAYDVGRVLNAKTAKSQMLGGIVYGLSMALHEHTAVDERSGRYLNADLSEYLVPVNADIHDIDAILLDSNDASVDEIGVKGLGEIGTTGAAAAVANAVFHATAVRARELPITLDKIFQASAQVGLNGG